MTKEQHQHRKDEHLSLAAKYWKDRDLAHPVSDFDALRLVPVTFPEMALSDVNVSAELFGYTFETPFYIEAMTGGSAHGDAVNLQLTEIAANLNLAMAVGSQSIALKYPELADGFRAVRQANPHGFIFANIGAGHDLEDAKRAVDMLDANALELHVNVIQELSMRDDEGDRSFYWLENIANIAAGLDVPVIVKEVGSGMSAETFRQLQKTGIAAINVGGSGGTNFAWIEHARNKKGIALESIGLSTAESLLAAKSAKNKLPLIATGGIRNASDMVKSQILGATLASSAGRILSALTESGIDATEELLVSWREDLRKLYLLQGARNLTELQQRELILPPSLLSKF